MAHEFMCRRGGGAWIYMPPLVQPPTSRSFPLLFVYTHKTPNLIPLVLEHVKRLGRLIYKFKLFLKKLLKL